MLCCSSSQVNGRFILLRRQPFLRPSSYNNNNRQGVSLSFYHSSATRNIKWGQANIHDEEKQIAIAIRGIRERRPKIVVEVMNAFHVDYASRLFPVKDIFDPLTCQRRIRILTRCDHLSPAALRYQMHRAATAGGGGGGGGYHRHKQNNMETKEKEEEIAVIAMNLSNFEKIKLEHLQPLLQVLAGAQEELNLGNIGILVCGLPNSGKSSLIYALTKSRTLEVKKKKHYHLPKISPKAGKTMGIKSHAVPHPTIRKRLITLLDTPGLRPKKEWLQLWDHAHILASGCKQIQKGELREPPQLKGAILQQLWQGLKRHAEVSTAAAKSTTTTQKIDFPYNSPQDLLLAATSRGGGNRGGETQRLIDLMDACQMGDYGGLIMEENYMTKFTNIDELLAASPPINNINKTPCILAMNQTAIYLQKQSPPPVGRKKKKMMANTTSTQTPTIAADEEEAPEVQLVVVEEEQDEEDMSTGTRARNTTKEAEEE